MNSLIKSQCDAHTSTVGSFGEILAGFLSFITLKKKKITIEYKYVTEINVLRWQICRRAANFDFSQWNHLVRS